MAIPRTIVVPLDGSKLAERALPITGTLAERLGSDVVLVSAPWDEDRDAAERYVQQVAAETSARVLETVVADDQPPVDAILAAVRDGPDRTVCMTTHGRGRFRWAMLGSVAEGVVSHSPEPVVLAGPRGRPEALRGSGRMVICVDGSTTSETIIPHACEWANAMHLDVEVAFVVHPLDVEDAEHPDAVLGPVADRVANEGLTAHPVLLRSTYPAGALIDLAESSPASLLAMTTHTRRGIARAVLGSVTMGVVNSSPCPVLVTRPEA